MSVQTTEDSGAIVAKALSSVEEIATLPAVTVKIIDTVEDPNSTARDLQEVIKHDPALSVKVLKVVNSAFYGFPRRISRMSQAVVLLGSFEIRRLVLSTTVFSAFQGINGHYRTELIKPKSVK